MERVTRLTARLACFATVAMTSDDVRAAKEAGLAWGHATLLEADPSYPDLFTNCFRLIFAIGTGRKWNAIGLAPCTAHSVIAKPYQLFDRRPCPKTNV